MAAASRVAEDRHPFRRAGQRRPDEDMIREEEEIDWNIIRLKDEITGKSGYKETRRLPKTRKTKVRWEDCVKRDLRKTEDEHKRRENDNDREL